MRVMSYSFGKKELENWKKLHLGEIEGIILSSHDDTFASETLGVVRRQKTNVSSVAA